MAKKKRKLQMGADILPIKGEEAKPIDNILFKNKAEHDDYYLKQSLKKLSPEDLQFYNDILGGKVKNITADSFIALKAPTPLYKPKKLGKSTESMGNVLGRAYGLKHGGIIEDNMGQLKHPGKVTKINSPNITMKGVNYPVLGISNKGDKKLMFPDNDYKFNGDSVTEYPLAQYGENIPTDPTFNWGAYNRGANVNSLTNASLPTQIPGITGIQNIQPVGNKPSAFSFGENQTNIPGGKGGHLGNITGALGGPMGIASTAQNIIGAVGMVKQDKEAEMQAKQDFKLSKLTKKASGLAPEKIKRKYHRPEDQIVDPNEMISSYGVGTNYLEDGGKVKGKPKKLQLGGIGGAVGSKIFGGTGQVSGAGQLGSNIGGTIGNLIPIPGAGMIGELAGGLIGGAIGAGRQKRTENYQEGMERNLGIAAMQNGAKNLQFQNSAFMRTGGNIRQNQMDGDLKVHSGGGAEQLSYNPYLPDSGETVMFRGQSHDDGGILTSFGNNPVEVEGGEPAVKLENGGGSSLTVFGNMKIPSFGVAEIGDPKAKGKKFKNYINDLSKIESSQNKVSEKGLNLINDTPVQDSFDKLKVASGEAMVKGSDMKLKEIAQKKKTASIIQNALLETADEFGLEPDALAKGNIKKARLGKTLRGYQDGGELPEFVSSKDIDSWVGKGWRYDQDNNRLEYKEVKKGESKTIPLNPSKGGKEFNEWFAKTYPNNKGQVVKSPKWGDIEMVKGTGNKTVTTPDSEFFKYIPIKDTEERIPSTKGMVPGVDVSRIPKPLSSFNQEVSQQSENKPFDWMTGLNAVLPFLRPSNELDRPNLSPEMYALANNQQEPVQAQLYHPLLQQASDISLQDQMNANQSDFNSIQRMVGNNPAALASLAGQKYAANTGVLGEQFRLNQANKQGIFNENRQTLNDAQLKNLGILDQQYVRQATAKSKTKETALAALSSISDKIAKNKLENKMLDVYENTYNYRFGPKGYAYNMNPLAQFNIPQVGTTEVDENGNVIQQDQTTVRRDNKNMIQSTTQKSTTTKKNFKNGSIVKALKSY